MVQPGCSCSLSRLTHTKTRIARWRQWALGGIWPAGSAGYTRLSVNPAKLPKTPNSAQILRHYHGPMAQSVQCSVSLQTVLTIMPSIERGVAVAASNMTGAPGSFTHQCQYITAVYMDDCHPISKYPGPGKICISL